MASVETVFNSNPATVKHSDYRALAAAPIQNFCIKIASETGHAGPPQAGAWLTRASCATVKNILVGWRARSDSGVA